SQGTPSRPAVPARPGAGNPPSDPLHRDHAATARRPMPATAPITQDLLTIPRKAAPEGPLNLIGLPRAELRAALLAIGTPEAQATMRTAQLWQWIYGKGARSFDEMTNLAKDYRRRLAENFTLDRPELVTRQVSADGTRKYLLRVAGGGEIETVY